MVYSRFWESLYDQQRASICGSSGHKQLSHIPSVARNANDILFLTSLQGEFRNVIQRDRAEDETARVH